MHIPNPASAKQLAFLQSLIADRHTDEVLPSMLSSRDASDMIGRLLNAPRKAVAPVETVTPGVYETPQGIFVVKSNREKTNVYAKKLVEFSGNRLMESGDVKKIEFEYVQGAIRHIRNEHRMPLERAKGLAIQYGCCLNCGRTLKDAKSVEQGIGPVCIKAFRL